MNQTALRAAPHATAGRIMKDNTTASTAGASGIVTTMSELNKAAQDAVKKKWDEIEQRFLNRLMNREFTRWFKNHTKDTPKKEDESK